MTVKEKLARMKAKKISQQQKREEEVVRKMKTIPWVLTVERDEFTTPPSYERKYVMTDSNTNEEDIIRWWNKTYYDTASDDLGPNSKLGSEWYAGAPKCIKAELYQTEKRDWIIMPTKK